MYRLLLAAVAAAGLILALSVPAAAQEQPKEIVFIDFVVMSEGHDLKDRDAYDAKAIPIAARYGIKRFASLDITETVVTPGLKPQRLDLWMLPSVQALNAWAGDPDYKALLAMRNEVHDMSALTLYLALPARPSREFGKNNYLIEMQKIGEGFDRELFAKYEQRSDEIAAAYSVHRAGVYTLAKKLIGIGPASQRLNVWYVPDADKLSAWGQDEAFKKLGGVRQKLFDLSQYLVLLAKGR